MLSYPAAVDLSSRTLRYAADLLRRHRRMIGSRWRKLPAARQALLVLAHLRCGDTYTRLAAGFGVGVATVCRCDPQGVCGPGRHADHDRPGRHARQDRPVFMHGDLQVAHVFIDVDQITGVVDWSEAGRGDALYDLASLTLGHEEHLGDVVAGYGTDVDLGVIRAW